MRTKTLLVFFVLVFLLAVSLAAGFVFGAVAVNPFDASRVSEMIFWNIRCPRVLLAALVGAMLSVSGAVLQGVLKNPLSDPYILGVSSGGAVGAVLSMLIGLPLYAVCIVSFLFALTSVAVVYSFSRTSSGIRPEVLVLAGVALSSLLGAALVAVVYSSDSLQGVYFWLFGSFSFSSFLFVKIAAVIAAVGISVSIVFSKQLNILLLGEEEAVSLGVNTGFVRAALLFAASLLSAVSVSMVGIIGFVGLIIPHIVRLVIGGNNILLIPASGLLGASFLVIADLLSRTLISPGELPVGIITAFVGAPFFIFLLRKKKND
ncbi:MAG: iron ABC transporter permease [Candidatus Margulisiibacteriota bacterium]